MLNIKKKREKKWNEIKHIYFNRTSNESQFEFKSFLRKMQTKHALLIFYAKNDFVFDLCSTFAKWSVKVIQANCITQLDSCLYSWFKCILFLVIVGLIGVQSQRTNILNKFTTNKCCEKEEREGEKNDTRSLSASMTNNNVRREWMCVCVCVCVLFAVSVRESPQFKIHAFQSSSQFDMGSVTFHFSISGGKTTIMNEWMKKLYRSTSTVTEISARPFYHILWHRRNHEHTHRQLIYCELNKLNE